MDDREFTNGALGSTGDISPLSRQQQRPGSPPPSRMTRDTPPGRIYVGNLPGAADRKFVEDLFSKYGHIVDISVKRTVSGTPFAFVEYYDPRDAQDAIRDKDGVEIEGSQLRVETPFQNRGYPFGQNRVQYQKMQRQGASGRRGEFRLTVHGLPSSGSWQDLKDHMREAGDCLFADVYRDGTGVVEFSRADDMEYALRHFQDSKFRSHEGETGHITLTRDEARPLAGGASDATGGNGYRDDGRRGRRYGSAPYPGGGGGSAIYGGANSRGGYDDRYNTNGHYPSTRAGGYESYSRGGHADGGVRGNRYGGVVNAKSRRSPSYSRRSRSRSRSYGRRY